MLTLNFTWYQFAIRPPLLTWLSLKPMEFGLDTCWVEGKMWTWSSHQLVQCPLEKPASKRSYTCSSGPLQHQLLHPEGQEERNSSWRFTCTFPKEGLSGIKRKSLWNTNRSHVKSMTLFKKSIWNVFLNILQEENDAFWVNIDGKWYRGRRNSVLDHLLGARSPAGSLAHLISFTLLTSPVGCIISPLYRSGNSGDLSARLFCLIFYI